MNKIIFLIMLSILLYSCGGKSADQTGKLVENGPMETELIIYADPSMEEFAIHVISMFSKKYPEVTAQLKIQSSEQVIEQMKNGQPVDVAMISNTESRKQIEWHKMGLLGGDKMVLVRCKKRERSKEFKSDHCWAIGASNSTEGEQTLDWLKRMRQKMEENAGSGQVLEKTPVYEIIDACQVVANSHEQLVDYLSKGWVEGGFCLQSTAAQWSDNVEVIDEDVTIDEAWNARTPKNRPHPSVADAFIKFVSSLEIRVWLSSKGFVVQN